MLGDDPLAEPLEREPRRRRRRAGRSAAGTRAAAARRARRDAAGSDALEAGEDRPPARRAADQHERVVRDADERRGEHGRRAPRRRSGCAAGAGTRAGRRPAAGRSSRGRSRGTSAARRCAAPPRTTRRRCRRRRGGRSRPRSRAPLSTSSLTRRATCCASARRQWTPVPAYAALSVTSSSTGVAEDRVGEVARRCQRLELLAELARRRAG